MDDDRYKRMISGKLSALDHIEKQIPRWHECYRALDDAKTDPDEKWGPEKVAAWLNEKRIRPPNPNGVRRAKWSAKTVFDRLHIDRLFINGVDSKRAVSDEESIFKTSINDTTKYGLGAIETLRRPSPSYTERQNNARADRAEDLMPWVFDRLRGKYTSPEQAVTAMGDYLTRRVTKTAIKLRDGRFTD